MKKNLLLPLLLAMSGLTWCQSVTPVLLGSGTGEGTLPGTQIFWSAGELAVMTLTNGANQITQGFWQPEWRVISGVNTPLQSEFGIACLPNPVSDALQITFTSDRPLDIELFGLDGRLLYQKRSILSGHVLSMAPWPASMYLLRFTTGQGAWILTKKIVKQ